jgi:hypothetical protein
VDTAEKEARKALGRLRRAAEKAVRELEDLEGALRHAEGADFPSGDYEGVRGALEGLLGFLEEEEGRLRDKLLSAGGLEPGRIRRSSS